MRILLIQQDMGRRDKVKIIFPIGLAYLAQAVSIHHTVKIFDPNISPSNQAFQELTNTITSFNPDLIAISIKYFDTTQRRDPFIFYHAVKPMIQTIKKTSPHVKLIAGGPCFSMFPTEIMNDIPEINYGIYQEGEDCLLDLIDHIDDPQNVKGIYYRKNGTPFFTGLRSLPNFSTLPMPATSLPIIDVQNYITDDYSIFGIQTKRGCALSCTYCNYPSLNGLKIRQKSPEQVVDEIEYMINNHHLRTFTFVDSVFNAPPTHAKDICKAMIRRNVKIPWGAWFDLNTFSEELLDLATKAGCRFVDFSPDANTQEGLRDLGKRISVKDIHDSVRMARKHKNVIFSYNFFCIHPKQTPLGALQLILFMIKTLITLPGHSRVSLGWIEITPNTHMYQLAKSEGLIKENNDLFIRNTANFRKAFYTKSELWYLDMFFENMLNFTDCIIKPMLKNIFKFLHIKYPFYY